MLELTLIIKWKVPKIVVGRKLACKISISNKWTLHKLCRFSNKTCLSTYWLNYGLGSYLFQFFPQLDLDVWAFIFQQMKSCIGQLVASCVKKNLLDVNLVFIMESFKKSFCKCTPVSFHTFLEKAHGHDDVEFWKYFSSAPEKWLIYIQFGFLALVWKS
jgi:hypothetical protein